MARRASIQAVLQRHVKADNSRIDFRTYLKNPDVCPYCGSKDLAWAGGVVLSKRDRDEGHREKECGNCGAEWYEDWKLTEFHEKHRPQRVAARHMKRRAGTSWGPFAEEDTDSDKDEDSDKEDTDSNNKGEKKGYDI